MWEIWLRCCQILLMVLTCRCSSSCICFGPSGCWNGQDLLEWFECSMVSFLPCSNVSQPLMSGREASDQVALAASHKHILLTFCGSVLPEDGVGEIINPGQLYLNVTVTLAGSCENCDFLCYEPLPWEDGRIDVECCQVNKKDSARAVYCTYPKFGKQKSRKGWACETLRWVWGLHFMQWAWDLEASWPQPACKGELTRTMSLFLKFEMSRCGMASVVFLLKKRFQRKLSLGFPCRHGRGLKREPLNSFCKLVQSGSLTWEARMCQSYLALWNFRSVFGDVNIFLRIPHQKWYQLKDSHTTSYRN